MSIGEHNLLESMSYWRIYLTGKHVYGISYILLEIISGVESVSQEDMFYWRTYPIGEHVLQKNMTYWSTFLMST